MQKRYLEEKTNLIFTNTSEALSLLYNSLPPGQQKTVLKNEEVKTLLERYQVIEK